MPGVPSQTQSAARRSARRAVAGLAVVMCAVGVGAASTTPDGRPTPTGFDVPRWITVSGKRAHARRGPSLDQPILWTYVARGLPVQVIAETREWRKICDPEGSVAWIHRSVTSGRRKVFNQAEAPVSIHTGRAEGSEVRARLGGHSLIAAERCEDGWCRVREGRLKGWVREDAVFGAAGEAQCDWRRPAGPASAG